MPQYLNNVQSYIYQAPNITGKKADGQYVWDSNVMRRYYSSIDVNIYIGNTYVDEAIHIAFAVQQQTMPIFGYNSYVYDTMAQGGRLVTGSFAVNFTKPNYFFDILEVAKKDKSIFYIDSVASKNQTKANTGATANNNSSAATAFGDTDKPIWDTTFDIDIIYGVDYAVHHIIEGVAIQSCQIIADGNGTPVMENYNFTARNLRTMQ